jgi:hypothetical protein
VAFEKLAFIFSLHSWLPKSLGPMLGFLNIIAKKFQKLAFIFSLHYWLPKMLGPMFQKNDYVHITLGFEKNANFSAENCRKL